MPYGEEALSIYNRSIWRSFTTHKQYSSCCSRASRLLQGLHLYGFCRPRRYCRGILHSVRTRHMQKHPLAPLARQGASVAYVRAAAVAAMADAQDAASAAVAVSSSLSSTRARACPECAHSGEGQQPMLPRSRVCGLDSATRLFHSFRSQSFRRQ